MDATDQPSRRDGQSAFDWDRMFQRQVQRGAETAAWLDRLALGPGDRCIDMGAGPGFFSLLLAERVGPRGVVYAIDRSPGALARLQREQQARGVAQIRRIEADGAAVDLPDGSADAALVMMMLHHAADPAGVMATVARLLRPGGRALLAEFHPQGTGEFGPQLARRVGPQGLRAWCEAAGLVVRDERRETAEHYTLLCERPVAAG